MRRKFFAILLALAMVLSLFPAAAFAADSWKTRDYSGFQIYDVEKGTYTLGDVAADVSILVIGRVTCSSTMDRLNQALALVEAMDIKNGSVYLLDVDTSQQVVAEYAARKPKGLHVAWSNNNRNYDNLFWDIIRDYYGSGTTSAMLPAICVLDGNNRLIYSVPSDGFDRNAFVHALLPYSHNTSDNFFVINENHELLGYAGTSKDIIIPDGVTSIGEKAFYGYTGLTSVTIPDSVTSIGEYAFEGCTSLASVTIPGNVTIILGGAFWGCTGLASVTIGNGVKWIWHDAFSGCTSLTSVTIPNSVIEIGDRAFHRCTGLTSVTISEGVTLIGRVAFDECTSLTSVTIPSSVISIGDMVFADCTGLTKIQVDANNESYVSVDGVLFNHDKTVLVSYPGGKQGAYTIPSSVTSIGKSAFSGCTGLTSVTIPASVTSIGEWAFSGCTGLTGVTIPSSVTRILGRAFWGCTGLTSVTIPSSVTEIGNSTFSGCSGLTSVTIPSSVTEIGNSTFSGCTGLTGVTIPSSVTRILGDAFWGCTGLTSVTIPASVTSIGESAFYCCDALSNVYYGGSEAQWKAISMGEYAGLRSYGVTVHYNSPMPRQPTVPTIVSTGLNPAASGTAYANTQAVKVDGKAVQFQCYALKDANGGETNYVKLRDLADVLDGTKAQFNVTWSEETKVGIQTGTAYSTRTGQEGKTPFSGNRSYQKGADTTLIDGAAVPLQAFFLTDDNGGDHTYYKLRDLGQALGFNVGWTEEQGVFIETDKPYDPSN